MTRRLAVESMWSTMSSSREASSWMSSRSSGVMKVRFSLSKVRWVMASHSCSRSFISRTRASSLSHRSSISSRARAASSTLPAS